MTCKAPFQWDELLTVYWWKTKAWEFKQWRRKAFHAKCLKCEHGRLYLLGTDEHDINVYRCDRCGTDFM